VLVVEDQLVNRMVARGYLERMGCTVVDAGTGAEGISAAVVEDFDLVLMDYDLPDMTGGDAAKSIRKAREIAPKIAVLTAHSIDDSPEKRAALSADRILHKPLSPRSLASVLEVAEPSGTAPNGPDVVASLRSDIDDIGADETAGIVAAFLDEVDPALAAMEAARATSDWPALARPAHRLKGAASNFALDAFCARLARVEEAALDEAEVSEALDGLDAAAAAAVQMLRAAAGKAGLQLLDSSASI